MATSANNSLNKQIVWSTTIVAFVALSVMVFGFTIYGYILQVLNPGGPLSTGWTIGDFVVLAFTVAVGQGVGAYVGWRLAKRLVRPLFAVTKAARTIAEGDFASRASEAGTFREADTLIDDFNHMAEMLQKAEEELKYSSSAIAHELRTPLTILRGRVQGLADGVYEPNHAMFISLLRHIDSLTRIVEDLRTLTMLNAGKLDLRISEFDFADEVNDILDSVASSLIEDGISIAKQFSRCRIRADRSRLRQAVIALIDNVKRYAPGTTMSVGISCEKSFCKFSISDQGPGLSSLEQRHAFEAFWRADDARSRSSGGSGLGLAVVKAIAEAHGGNVTIHGRPGKGTVVTFSVPRWHDN